MFCMSEWSEATVARFAASMRKRRRQLGLSAQQLADRTKELGHPVNRSSIAGWENGTRGDRLLLGDALVLAEALNTPLAALLFPDMPDGPVDAAPDWSLPSVEAGLRLSGVDDGGYTPWADGDGLPDGEAMRERETGFFLPSWSHELRNLRAELENYRFRYELALAGEPVPGGPEDLPRLRRLIDSLETRITELTTRIREAGGTVHDG